MSLTQMTGILAHIYILVARQQLQTFGGFQAYLHNVAVDAGVTHAVQPHDL